MCIRDSSYPASGSILFMKMSPTAVKEICDPIIIFKNLFSKYITVMKGKASKLSLSHISGVYAVNFPKYRFCGRYEFIRSFLRFRNDLFQIESHRFSVFNYDFASGNNRIYISARRRIDYIRTVSYTHLDRRQK